ncbi:ribosomal protein [Cyclospora cayetanensis]|uniref:Ribosomal protein n=1 Tax=Cyclospora cayetanensis TaxID=88456 RepID=A0A1D3CYT1_9EIME|nr:ribosomal protein [Cyclospora cayetanensis]
MSRFVKAYLKAKRLNQRQTPLPWTPRFLELSKEPSIPPPLRERQQPQRVDLAKHLNIKEGDLVRPVTAVVVANVYLPPMRGSKSPPYLPLFQVNPGSTSG